MGNRLRAGLTTLGIIIGVASVMAMLALGNGARAAVEDSFRFLGSDNIRATAKFEFDDGELVPVGKNLSYEDGLLMRREVPLVDQVVMSVSGGARARHGRSAVDMVVTGATFDALESLAVQDELRPVGWTEARNPRGRDYIAEGRFFSPAEVLSGADICVLGHQTAQDLFEGDRALDQIVWVNRQRCTVIGVLAELESNDPLQNLRGTPNVALYLPISTAIGNLFDEEPSVRIIARATDEDRMGEAKAQVADFLRERHGVEQNFEGRFKDDFDLTTRRDILGAQQESARTFSLLLAAMAVVSLIVGGIGIMNVMLVSVTERTREIGVRMAVGARSMDVISQFLLEAVLISALGGVLGIGAGILAVPLAASLNGGVALLAPASIPIAFMVAVITGVAFGLYPAVRASQLDPIDALRHE
jgi:putative ABC transport system permease protein